MVRYLTTNGTSGIWLRFKAFALRYRRVNATFYEAVKVPWMMEIVTPPGRICKTH